MTELLRIKLVSGRSSDKAQPQQLSVEYSAHVLEAPCGTGSFPNILQGVTKIQQLLHEFYGHGLGSVRRDVISHFNDQSLSFLNCGGGSHVTVGDVNFQVSGELASHRQQEPGHQFALGIHSVGIPPAGGSVQLRPGYSLNAVVTPWGIFNTFQLKVKPSRRLGEWLADEYRLIARLRPRFNKTGVRRCD